MPTSELRQRVTGELVDFAWNEWAQMGILATPMRESRWAADPEALLLTTLQVGQHDPRLFDEVLDWLTVNGGLISRQRLRNLCIDEQERSLADAALAWASEYQPALRSASKPETARTGAGRPIFPASRRVARPDAAFLTHGWVKPLTMPSGKSVIPDLNRPTNFAFRLRLHFGVGSRAEIVRFLLTSRLPGAQGEVVRRASGYTKRNVLEAANALVSAGAIGSYTLGSGKERFYRADIDRWQAFLGGQQIPSHRDWPQLLRALRVLQRRLEERDLDRLSDYLRASEARQLMKQIEPDLSYAGVEVSDARTGADYWETFVENVNASLSALTTPWP